MNDAMPADTKTVLITGASSGIGLACAQRLAARGLRVFASSRRASLAEPAPFEFVTMDVTSDESVGDAIERVLAASGRIDVLINNAGHVLAGPLELTDLREARAQFETNFFGVLRVCQAVLPSMRARQQGLIVNVGSLGGLIGMPYQGLYSASKFALEGLTETLRHELRPFGVRATIIEPGDIQTPITDNRIFARAARASSDYSPGFERTLVIIEREERAGPPPERVAALIDRIVHGGDPAPRYTVGAWSQTSAALAKRLLPARVFEWAIARFYALR
ncbi:SDR family oxidoreductase [Nannocystaceae bacterium ST9]